MEESWKLSILINPVWWRVLLPRWLPCRKQEKLQLNGQLLCCLSQQLLPASGSGTLYNSRPCSLGKMSVCQKFELKLNQNSMMHELTICQSLSPIIHCHLHLYVCVYVCVCVCVCVHARVHTQSVYRHNYNPTTHAVVFS